jgi:hypothetical protein
LKGSLIVRINLDIISFIFRLYTKVQQETLQQVMETLHTST